MDGLLWAIYFESRTRFAKGYFNKLYLLNFFFERLYLNRLERLNQPINDNKYAKIVNVFVLFKKNGRRYLVPVPSKVFKGYLLV